MESNTIEKYSLEGKFINYFGNKQNNKEENEFKNPYGIKINSKNDYIISDYGNDCIKIFDLNENFLFQFGSKGNNNGQFGDWTLGIEIDQFDRIYVTDYYNNRIQIFESDGNFINKFGSNGNELGQFKYPSGISINNNNGNLFITDTDNHRIVKVSPSN